MQGTDEQQHAGSVSSTSSSLLLHTFSECFTKDPFIDEYDFVLLPGGPSKHNKEGPPSSSSSSFADAFLMEEHKLAIATWIVKPLFKASKLAFQKAYHDHHHQQQQHIRISIDLAKALMESSRPLLMINPDVYTVWNLRKLLIIQEYLREEEELMFLDLILSKHTKKNAAWSHRKWCLGRRFFSLGEKSSLVLWGKGLIDHELDVTAKIAELYPKNYYAWTHRWWMILQATNTGLDNDDDGDIGGTSSSSSFATMGTHDDDDAMGGMMISLLKSEVAFAEAWIDRHAWDASAMSYLHQILARLIYILQLLPGFDGSSNGGKGEKKTTTISTASDSEGKEEEKAMGMAIVILHGLLERGAMRLDRYPGHESLWYQRRGLVELYIKASSSLIKDHQYLTSFFKEEQEQQSTTTTATLPSYPLPFSSSSSLVDLPTLQERLRWELQLTDFYRSGQRHDDDNLLWDELMGQRQRMYAWGHKAWICSIMMNRQKSTTTSCMRSSLQKKKDVQDKRQASDFVATASSSSSSSESGSSYYIQSLKKGLLEQLEDLQNQQKGKEVQCPPGYLHLI